MIESIRIKDYVKALNTLKLPQNWYDALKLETTNELKEKLTLLQKQYPNVNITVKTYIAHTLIEHLDGTFKEKLRQLYYFSASHGTFTKNLKNIESLYPIEYKQLKEKAGVDDRDLLTLYIINALNHCEVCGKPCSGRFCCNKCKSSVVGKENIKKAIQAVKINKDEVVKKRKATNLKKYGVEFYTQTSQYRDKIKQTNLERYGVESSNQADEVKEKMRQTKLKRYGDATFNNRTKSRETFYKNFDIESTRSKREKYNLKKYGVIVREWTRYENYHNLTPEYIKKTFIDNNGRFKFNEFVLYFKIPYLKTAYDIKERLGFKDVLNNHHFNTKSHVEKELFEWFPVQDKISNNRSVLDGLEIDIFSPSYNIGIEYDGIFWHSTANISDSYYHVKKLEKAESKGIILFNIFEKIDDLEIWKSMILNKLGQSRRIYARKCEVRRVDYNDIREFLAENHLQGAVTSSINYALYYGDELVEVMTFKRPRFTKDYDFELLRLCTKKETTIVGGASKIFKAFRRDYPTASVISYANRRWSRGDVYRRLGFELLKVSAPNYWYVRGDEVLSRYQAQKHKLPQLLGESFDPELSESENMLQAGFERIYDCGNLVFGFKP